jgi:hypothetical protein
MQTRYIRFMRWTHCHLWNVGLVKQYGARWIYVNAGPFMIHLRVF